MASGNTGLIQAIQPYMFEPEPTSKDEEEGIIQARLQVDVSE